MKKSLKKQLLIVFFLVLGLQGFAQISFEKGYYITDAGEKIECLIKNVDWRNNPTEFKYRLNENSKQEKQTIKNVKEFGIYNYSKYIKKTVEIDKSSENIAVLSKDKNPIFEEEEVFLEVLIEGKSNLYLYENEGLIRFFYKESNATIQQLVFKSYQIEGLKIAKNNEFRKQLLATLNCKTITMNNIQELEYTQRDLVRFFVLKNQCNNSEIINFYEKQKRDFFNLSLRPGINFSSLINPDLDASSIEADFGNKQNIRLGLEFEFVMAFHKNKWAVIVEPTYQYYNSEKVAPTFKVKIDYKSIEIPVGLRHYFYLSEKDKIFINGSYIFDVDVNSSLTYLSDKKYKITSQENNFAFGIGYKLQNKFSVELRYQTTRDLYNDYFFLDLEYNTMSFILGYTLF